MNKAEELFRRVLDAVNYTGKEPKVRKRLMLNTLVLTCFEGLKHTQHSFGNLSSQVHALCQKHNIAPQDKLAIQAMRRHCNDKEKTDEKTFLNDCHALAMFIAAVFQTSIPHFLVGKIAAVTDPRPTTKRINYHYIRCVVLSWNENTITAQILNQDTNEAASVVNYTDTPSYLDFTYLRLLLREGMQLNLLDCNVEGKVIKPKLIVVEPDFLLDISTIANCFEFYGHHPLLHLVHRMQERPNTRHTLLGNFASAALDDIVNQTHNGTTETIKLNFRNKALEFATCDDLDPKTFKKEAEQQTENLKGIIGEVFQQFDRNKAIIEPSFVCEQLGIQGRVDLMTIDRKLLVEQKAGKNIFIENQRKNSYGSWHIEKHYVQVLLYFGVLHHNFRLSNRQANIRLIYSKYPMPNGLLGVEPLQKLLNEAIKFRNQVVATEYWIAERGFEPILPLLLPSTLQTQKGDDSFFQRFILPQLNDTLLPLHRLNALEKAYFSRMMRFVIKEQIIGKVGKQEGVGSTTADLWNMPLVSKMETGNIYTDLTIERKERSEDSKGYDLITLNVPTHTADFLPNFRRGDMVFFYAYKKGETPDVRRSTLFKGTLTHISTQRLVVKLNDAQQNPNIIAGELFAIEHSGSDVMSSAAIHALHVFATSCQERKDLLLGNRKPTANIANQLTKTYHPAYDDIVLRAKQANDFFLLIGPPGTGKTSMALQFLIREHAQENILLLSYTNRAVDEICAMLSVNNIDFIRIGNEHSCDPAFKPHLLSQTISDYPTLSGIQSAIKDARIIVGTTASITTRPFLFNIKHFDLAIVDEASQILEPNIIGLLGAHRHSKVCIDKFILIGDHKQLPAVVQQDEQEASVDHPALLDIELTNCANSLFERFIRLERRAGREQFIGTLRRQGRMHPDIAAFPNTRFYSREQLECVPLPHQEETMLNYPMHSEDATDDFLKQHRMIFIAAQCCKDENTSDKVNIAEARIVADMLRRVYRQTSANFDPQKTVGVIVPYRNQIAMIRKEIEHLQIPSLEHISIDTVERYQGSQRDVIIYSFTIQNSFQLDFLTANTFEEDGKPIDRKLNVAITRARKQLILTGYEPILRQNPLFSDLIDHIQQHGGYLPIK